MIQRRGCRISIELQNQISLIRDPARVVFALAGSGGGRGRCLLCPAAASGLPRRRSRLCRGRGLSGPFFCPAFLCGFRDPLSTLGAHPPLGGGLLAWFRWPRRRRMGCGSQRFDFAQCRDCVIDCCPLTFKLRDGFRDIVHGDSLGLPS